VVHDRRKPPLNTILSQLYPPVTLKPNTRTGLMDKITNAYRYLVEQTSQRAVGCKGEEMKG